MPESHDSQWAETLARIIRHSRVATGHEPLTDGRLAEAVAAWGDLLSDTDPATWEFAYHRLMRDRQFRGALQAKELRDACLQYRSEAARARLAAEQREGTPIDPEQRCAMCNDEGYQRIRIYCPSMQMWRTVARGCGCAKTPPMDKRADPKNEARGITRPVKPPRWTRDAFFLWSLTDEQPDASPLCRCINCEPWRAKKA